MDAIAAGNAPAYPVLFAARVSRARVQIILRGETQPFGQYALFLPPDGELVDVSFYDPKTRRFGIVTPYASPNAPYALPRFTLFALDDDAVDNDRDGLPDAVEHVLGTNNAKPDSDGDGIPDGAEVEQGTNPLDGFVARTGVIATAKTPGPAVDVWTGNDVVVTAEGAAGLSIFNAYTGSNPTMLSHVPTPGGALRVSGSGNYLAVASGDAGASIIDLSAPGNARILHQVPLAGAQAVAADAARAFVGLKAGAIVVIDLRSGFVRERVGLQGAVEDLMVEGDHLYVLTGDRLDLFSLGGPALKLAGSVAVPWVAAPNQRLFVGGGFAYTVHRKGFNTLDVTNPARPVLVTRGETTQFGWKHLVANGSGLGLAAVGPNSTDDGPRDVQLYDLSNPRANNTVVTTVPTPGQAAAVSILNGLVYVADDKAGFQVVSYLAYDAKGVAPQIALRPGFGTAGVEEGKPARLTALATDDVQVRNVEFYLDGARVTSDGNFPFEFRFITPALTADKKSFRLRARAFDTGGNATWSEELTVALLPDVTAPRVQGVAPVAGAKVATSVVAFFDEPLRAATVTAAAIRLFGAGPDGQTGTADDVAVAGGVAGYVAESSAIALNFGRGLPDGLYRAVVDAGVSDVAGNRMGAEYAWSFRVADATFWIRPGDGVWSDPLNWSTGVVPGPNDHVIIDLDRVDLTVTHPAGTIQARSLIVNENFKVVRATVQIPGVIEVGKTITLEAATLVGSTLLRGPGGKILFPDVGSNNTFDGVTVEGDLELNTQNARVLVRNGLRVRNGWVRLNRNGGISFLGTQTFGEGGFVFEGDSAYLGVEQNAVLTLGPDVVVRGKSGFIGQALAFIGPDRKLINQGQISADVAGGTLTLMAPTFENRGRLEQKSGGAVAITSTGWSNSGEISAAGGTLVLDGLFTNTGLIRSQGAEVIFDGPFTPARLGRFERSGGKVQVRDLLDLRGAVLTLDASTGSWTFDGATVVGGTIVQKDGARAVVAITGILCWFDGVTVEGDLALLTPNAIVAVRNGLTLRNGVVRLNNNGALSFSGTQTLREGTIVFEGDSGNLGIEANTTLTLGPGVLVRGKTGLIGRSFAFLGAGRKLVNEGTISADVSGGTITIGVDTFENKGTLEQKNGGKIARP